MSLKSRSWIMARAFPRPPHKPDIDRKIHGEEDPRGMGMFLIQALVDEAEWVRDSKGKGSYVRLVIRLDKENE